MINKYDKFSTCFTSFFSLSLIKVPLIHFCVSTFIFLGLFFGCTSYEKFKYITEELEIPTKVYNADYNQTWQAVLQVMKKFDLEHKNQEAGVIRTNWIENTTELNFSDSFGNSDAVKAAKFKITMNVMKGFRLNREVTKVSISKRQLVEQDFLQGWKEIPTDVIVENTLLYRIDRLINIDKKLKEIEKQKEAEQLKTF